MLKIDRLLFPTDHSDCAEAAFGHALALATLYDAELHVLTALELFDDELADDLDVREATAETFAPVEHERVRIVRVAELGAAASDVILDYSERANIDLVVMATHGRRGMAHLLQGSVAELVVREAPCPVLTLRCDAPTLETGDTENRILVPFDFSDRSRYALDYAADLAQAFHAELELVHVVSDAMWPDVYGYDVGAYNTEVLQTRAQTALDRLATELRASGLTVITTVDVGFPTTRLAEYAAETRADLIVMASHGLTGLKRLLMGSVAENTVRLAPCPVLVVKPFGKSLLPERDLAAAGMTTA